MTHAEGAGVENPGYVVDAFDASKPPPKDEKDETKTAVTTGCWTPQRRVTVDVTVLSVAYLFLFTAFKGSSNLQSSINAEGGVGTAALSAYYAAFIASSIFLPAIMIKKLGCKWTMTICAGLYAPFMAANLRPSLASLVPTALLAGMGAGPIWSALSTYTSLAGQRIACATPASTPLQREEAAAAATTRLYGIFYFVYQLHQVSGNLISSLILSTADTAAVPAAANASLEASWLPEAPLCGFHHCPTTVTEVTVTETAQAALDAAMAAAAADAASGEAVAAPIVVSATPVTILSIVFFSFVLSATGLLGFVIRPVKRRREAGKAPSALELLSATLKQLRHRNMLLLLPIFFFFGTEKAFLGAGFTEAYLSCALGVENLGFVLICYGVTNSAASAVAGWVTPRVGRRAAVSATLALDAVLLGVLFGWAPASAADSAPLFGLAALWGLIDGLWLVQINSLVSQLFPGSEEAAFSNYHLWESAGYIAVFVTSAHFCIEPKLYGLVVLLLAAAACYLTLEVRAARLKRQAKTDKETEAAASA